MNLGLTCLTCSYRDRTRPVLLVARPEQSSSNRNSGLLKRAWLVSLASCLLDLQANKTLYRNCSMFAFLVVTFLKRVPERLNVVSEGCLSYS